MRIDFFRVLKMLKFPVEEARKEFEPATTDPSWQINKAWEIFNFHYQHNPFYRELVGKPPLRWEDLPVITRNHLKGDFTTKLPSGLNPKNLYCSSTSGSSGDPLYFARDRMSHALVWLNVEHLYNSAGISVNNRQARMFGISQKPVAKLKARLKDFLSNRYRFNVFDLSDEGLLKWETRFRRDKFTYIYGYTNSLVAFAKYLKNKDLTLKSISPSLKGCIVTSEVCTDKDAATISEAFGIPVYNEYGSSELGVMGFKTDGYWIGSDSLIKYEVLDENNNPVPEGQAGYLTCTALFNKATPFIRYRIGDLASIRHVNGQTHIETIMGSLNDMAILPSGKKVPGISFYFVAEPLLSKAPFIKEFLVRQTKEWFEFEYVAERELSASDIAILTKSFDSMLEKDIPLKTLRVEKLQRGRNGKFKHFISEI